MKLRLIALILAGALALTACKASSSSPAPSPSESGASGSGVEPLAPGEFPTLVKDGKFVFVPLEQVFPDADLIFTMEYEPAATAVTRQHLGLQFPSGMDTDWLGDAGVNANYTIYDTKDREVRGTVKITTAPPDLAAQYGTSDPAEQLEMMKSSYFPAADVFTGLKKAVVEDFGYELVFAEQAVAESLGWNGFYLEFIDRGTATRSMRFFVCNDEMNEKYYSFTANADLPVDDEEMANRYRSCLFTLVPMGQ